MVSSLQKISEITKLNYILFRDFYIARRQILKHIYNFWKYVIHNNIIELNKELWCLLFSLFWKTNFHYFVEYKYNYELYSLYHTSSNKIMFTQITKNNANIIGHDILNLHLKKSCLNENPIPKILAMIRICHYR